MTDKKKAKKEVTAKKHNDAAADNGYVEVVFILDRSGSMTGLEDDTIGGFNSMLKKQREEGNDIVWSTILFDHITEVVHDRVNVDKIEDMDERTYFTRGSTALLDAVGGAIKHIDTVHKYARDEDRPKKTIFIITTDGYENSSCIYDYRQVRKLIESHKERYDWDFIFLGANIDAVAESAKLGIDAEYAANYHNDSKGIAMRSKVVSDAISSAYACGFVDPKGLDEIREDYENREEE